MASKRSKEVDNAIKRSWARLASAAFRRAVTKLDFDKPADTEFYMVRVERRLDKAGAEATKWHFN